MTADRIFSDAPRRDPAAVALVMVFALVLLFACLAERGEGEALYLLFAVPAVLFGFVVGRWWAVLAPVVLTTAAVAVGFECSVSEVPQALLLAGTLAGVVTRRTGDRLAGRP